MFKKYILKNCFWRVIFVLISVAGIVFICNNIKTKDGKKDTNVRNKFLPNEAIWQVTVFPTNYYGNSYNIILGNNGILYTQMGQRKNDEIVNGRLTLTECRNEEKSISKAESIELNEIVNSIMRTNTDNKLPLDEAVACVDDGWIMTVEKTGNMVYSFLYEDDNMIRLIDKLTKGLSIKIDTNNGWGGLP